MVERQLWLKGVTENPGEYLKRQREMRGVSLEDISKVTKINIKLLNALESDSHENLPHQTFVKGFIRSYCKYAGIDADDAVLHYEEYLNKKAEKESNVVFAPSDAPKQDNNIPLVSKKFAVIASVALLIAVSFIGYIFYYPRPAAHDPQPATRIDETPKNTTALAPQTAYPSVDAEEPKKEPEKTNEAVEPQKDAVLKGAKEAENTKKMPLQLVVSAHKTTWIRVEVDKEKPFEVSLRDGENITWEAKEKFLLIIGNAGGVELTFNGKPVGKIGENGQVVKLVLPQDKTGN
ncbi:MAG: helix-turn-helix domain-containing protein [Deltaproteobacteria bacterium]|nr:helix-turn-helix domain-containing protein [Deltaproteobacteria bacterium]